MDKNFKLNKISKIVKFGKKIQIKKNFQNSEVWTKSSKNFVEKNSRTGNIIWGYKPNFPFACFLLVAIFLIFCFIVKNQHPRGYSWRDIQTDRNFVSILEYSSSLLRSSNKGAHDKKTLLGRKRPARPSVCP